MKTPEQVAAEVLYGDNPRPLYHDPVEASTLARMVQAIEADRAQRDEEGYNRAVIEEWEGEGHELHL